MLEEGRDVQERGDEGTHGVIHGAVRPEKMMMATISSTDSKRAGRKCGRMRC